jgi:hypothetical protein
VCFNAHRVFSPQTIRGWFSAFHLVEFSFVDDAGVFRAGQETSGAAELDYACGMFVFERSA